MAASSIRMNFKSILTGSFPEEHNNNNNTKIPSSVGRDCSSSGRNFSKLVKCNSLIQGSMVEEAYHESSSEVSVDEKLMVSIYHTATTTTDSTNERNGVHRELISEPKVSNVGTAVPVLKKVIVTHITEDDLLSSEIPDVVPLSSNDNSLDTSDGLDSVPVEVLGANVCVEKGVEHDNQVPSIVTMMAVTTTKNENDSRSHHPYFDCMGIDDLPDAEVGANADEIFLQAIVESMKLDEDASIPGRMYSPFE